MPRRFLLDDEEVISIEHQHAIGLFPSVVLSTVIIAGLISAFVLWRSAPTWFGIALGGVFVFTIAYLATRIVQFRTTQVILTTQRLVARRGVFRRSTKEIPISSIVDLGIHQRLLQRMIRLGEVEVTTTGQSEPVRLSNLSAPKDLVTRVHSARSALEQRRVSELIAKTTPVDPDRERRELQRLHRKGVITQREYDERSARIANTQQHNGGGDRPTR